MIAFLVDLENRPGELASVAEGIARAGVNITGVAGLACGSGGRVALLTNDDAATRSALQEAQRSFQEMETTEVAMRDEPGTLARAFRMLADAGINIEALLPTGMAGQEVQASFVTTDAARARQVLSGMATGMR
jgi:hypothetical protein